MRPLSYTRPGTLHEAVAIVSADPAHEFLAGGTSEVDLIRAGVLRTDVLVDINRLPLTNIEPLPDGGVRIGALARMSDAARDPLICDRFPAVSQALLLAASEQLRNMASIGGNLCQRVRCPYFRDLSAPCNRRDPESGCSALDGVNRGHAILGTSGHCIATHPSDLAVALVAFDAVVHTLCPDGEMKTLPLDDLYLLPGYAPHIERRLEHGELIVAVELPGYWLARQSLYLKLRDRRSYEFALVSVAAAIDVDEGIVADVRLALGGVGTKPWRALRAERELIGAPATPQQFAAAAAVELAEARVRRDNAFKVELTQRAVVRALTEAMSAGAR
jgi:xanthine dehydrogenase YagS FAD-binding subunit